jgi:hypothetical protein
MARRIAAILLLTPELNANHTDVKDNACAGPKRVLRKAARSGA